MSELGAVVLEVKRPPQVALIVLGAVAILGGAWSTSVHGSPVTLVGAGLFGAFAIWWAAVGSRKSFRIYERGVSYGATTLAFDQIKIAWDGVIGLRGMKGGGLVGAAATRSWSDLVLGDGTRAGAMRIDDSIVKSHRAQVDAMLKRALAAAVARERAVLAKGGTYKVDSRDTIEVTATELRAPAPTAIGTGATVALPFSGLSIRDNAAYRSAGDKPAAMHDALAQDLLLRALLESYGVRTA